MKIHLVCLTILLSIQATTAGAASLESKLRPLIESHAGTMAVAIRNLTTGEEFAHNADSPMPTAGLIKFPVMVEAYRQAESGEVATEIRQEWRTPPLWGVADSPPYLHDGRAPTLSKAILLHGGEAAKSRQRFAALSSIDRDAIESFLMTLRAPRQNVADKRLGGVSAF